MSALPAETTEPDPVAPLPVEETVNEDEGEKSAAPEKDSETGADKQEELKESNGSAEVNEANNAEKSEEKTADKGDETKKNGHVKKGHFKEHEKENSSRRTHYNTYPKGPNHSKYDPSVLEATDDHKQIRAQVEFYFGDANLPTDQYLWDLTDGSSNKPVPISTICRFGRMKRFEPISNVVAALRQSGFLDVAGPEGEETVKRKVAYDPTVARYSPLKRSVYVKGFGDEEPSSQFDIEAFFAPYGPTNAVRLRRTNEKAFKGSVFVEFADEETAQKFLALDPKPKWKGEHGLEIKSKKEYTDGKEKDIKEGRMEPSESWAPSRGGRGGFRGRGRGRGRGGNDSRGDRDRGNRDRRDRDPDDWKKRREEDRAAGFKGDRKSDRNRGGRSNQRGGRRGGRDDRSGDHEAAAPKKEEASDVVVKEDKPENGEKSGESAVNEKKRPREDDIGGEQPAKKVDMKPESAVEAS